MRTALGVVALLLFASTAEAQLAPLPHNIPHLCAGDPNKVTVSAGDVAVLNGDLSCVEVFGVARVFGLLKVGQILCYSGGTLIFEDFSETVIADKPIDTATDPEQWGHGAIAVDCTVRATGRVVQSHMRLIVEPLAGASTLTLATIPQGWQIGDRLVIGDTRHLAEGDWFNASLVLQHEVRQIASMNGATVMLDAPLTFNHRGARNADGTLRLLPHVGNLSRSIVIRSENPNGTRGHLAFTGRSAVDLRGVAFVNLGRTTIAPLGASNIVGKYPVHMHHLWGPVNATNTGYQYIFEGNAIEGSLKWPIAIHRSSHGLVRGNVIFGAGNMTGACIALEDGSETDNRIEGNFCVDVRGNVNPRVALPKGAAPGSGGDCIWGAGFNNRFVNNVLVGCRNAFGTNANAAGIKLAMPEVGQGYTDRNPIFRGADMTDPAQTVAVLPQMQPILEMRGNEVYGLAATGLTLWWLGTSGYQIPAMAESIVKDFTVWHTWEGVYWGYPTNRVTFDGVVYRMGAWSFDPYGGPVAFTAGDYRTGHLTVRNADIHAGSVVKGLIDPVGDLTFEHVEATTRSHAYQLKTPATPGAGGRCSPANQYPATVRIIGGQVSAWPGQPLRTISMTHDLSYACSDPATAYNVIVSDYQQTGAAFQVYFPIQAATSQYYGGQAPAGASSTARPEIAGLTFDSGAPPPPPPPPVDSDGDGVPDSADLCPGTPIGTQVDSTGCPIVIPPPPAVIAVDALTTFTTDNVDDPSVVHVTTGTPSLALVSVSKRRASALEGVLYGDVPMSLLVMSSTDGSRGAFIYKLENPPPGNQTVTVQTSGSAFLAVIAVHTYTGAVTTGATSSSQGRGVSATGSLASATGDLVVDTLFKHEPGTVTPGAGQTERWDAVNDNVRGFGSTQLGAATVTIGASWAATSDWFYVAVVLVR